jgi:uncharacterized protein
MNAALLSLCLTATMAAPSADASPKPTRVLIVTGVDYVGHPWKETAPALRNALDRDKRIEARVVEDPEFLASPIVSDYDVIVLHFKNYQPFARAAQVRENLARLVKEGKGLVLIHFACGAFDDWPEFANLAGKVWDGKTTHDPRGPFQVEIVQKDHPITRGMANFKADDELYFCLTGQRPVEIIATAQSKVVKKACPMAFVFNYGKGRVFHTPLGHDVRAIEMPGVVTLLQRACLWTAGREP